MCDNLLIVDWSLRPPRERNKQSMQSQLLHQVTFHKALSASETALIFEQFIVSTLDSLFHLLVSCSRRSRFPMQILPS